jgi:multidrug efflux system membrane fusion protein
MSARRWCVWMACSVLLLARGAPGTADEPAPPEVAVVKPPVRQVADQEEFTGRTEAASAVDVRARVTGRLDKVHFKDGSEVKEGELLFEIDPRLYRAELARAEAALAEGEARLKRLDADLKRMKALLDRGAVGREEYEKLLGDRSEAEATLAAARAALQIAKLNLEYATVKAAISGRIGRRLVDVGNLVRADETVLAAIVSEKPAYVVFEVDDRTVLRLRRAVRDGKVKGATDPGLPVAVGLADEDGFPHRGRLDFMDNRVDPERGTLLMRATLPNSDGLIMPGLFARVRLTVGEPSRALLVPEEAVLKEEGQASVLVVGDKGVLESKKVVLGPRVGRLRAVREGLGEDDRVVSKARGLRTGSTVRPQNVTLRDDLEKK